MDQTTLTQAIDFQQIAVTQLERDNPATAQDFAEEVLGMLREAHDAEGETDSDKQ